MKLGIIGTAGRGDDAARLTDAHYRMMCVIAQTVAAMVGATRLVSGGAAYADHVAVSLYLDGAVPDLALYLPVRFNTAGSINRFEPNQVGATANRYHVASYYTRKVDSLDEIAMAIKKGATVTEEPPSPGFGAFFARNTKIANEADVLLAFTFSGGPLPKDGGTRDTWDKFSGKADRLYAEAEAHYQETPCGCQNNLPDEPLLGYHFDLSTRKMHRHEFWPQVAKDEREHLKATWARVDPVQNLVSIVRTKYEIENNLL